jgi:hypothetical protein
MANRRRVLFLQRGRYTDALVTGTLAGWLDGRGRRIGVIDGRSRPLLQGLLDPVATIQPAILRSLRQIHHIGLPRWHWRRRDSRLPHQRLVELPSVSKSTPRVFSEQEQEATHHTIGQIQPVWQH